MSELRIELLIGTQVRDREGRKAGRIEDFRAKDDGQECVITHFMIGRGAIAGRLSVHGIGSTILAGFGATHRGEMIVPWAMLDISDVKHPRLRCSRDELKKFQQQPVGP